MKLIVGNIHEDAINRVKNKLPGKYNRYYRGHIGQEDQASHQTPQGKFLVHNQRYAQPYQRGS